MLGMPSGRPSASTRLALSMLAYCRDGNGKRECETAQGVRASASARECKAVQGSANNESEHVAFNRMSKLDKLDKLDKHLWQCAIFHVTVLKFQYRKVQRLIQPRCPKTAR